VGIIFNQFKVKIQDAIDELTTQINFVEAATKSPVLLFTSTDKVLKNDRASLYITLGYDNGKFREYMANLMNSYFSNNCPYNLTISPRSKSQTSIFAIYNEDVEIAQFNIFEQWYGIRDKPSSEDDIMKEHQRLSDEKNKEMALVNERIQKWESVLDHPYRYVYNFYLKNKKLRAKSIFQFIDDSIHLLFNKSLIDKINNKMEQEKDKLKEINARYDRHSFDPEELIASNKEKETYIKFCVDFFELHQYSLQQQHHRLY
jgi:hypothetical protein